MNIEKRVIKIVREQLCVDSVTAESSMADDLDADSLDLVELGMVIEEEFDIEVGDADVEKFSTVRDIITFIEGKQK